MIGRTLAEAFSRSIEITIVIQALLVPLPLRVAAFIDRQAMMAGGYDDGSRMFWLGTPGRQSGASRTTAESLTITSQAPTLPPTSWPSRPSSQSNMDPFLRVRGDSTPPFFANYYRLDISCRG